MCLIRNCPNTKDPLIGDWRLTDRLCETHYKAIQKYLTKNGTVDIEITYLSDYIGLKAMMIEQQTVLKHLYALGKEMHAAVQEHKKTKDDWDDRFRTEKKDRGYIRLSRVLENYEGYCWFPACHRIFVAGLSAQDFYWYIAHGYMVKDPGPDTRHGDFTHRYQWHAIMRHLTENFSKPLGGGFWHHTPLDLFTSMGKGAAKEAGIWGKILDRDDASPPDFVDYNTFSNPNNLHFALVKAGFHELTTNTDRRLVKRRTAADMAQKELDKWSALHQDKWSAWLLEGTEPTYSDLAGLLYAWRKSGGQPLGVDKNVPPLAAKTNAESSKDFDVRRKAWIARRKLANAAEIAEWIYKTDINEGAVDALQYKNGQPTYQFIITPESKADFSVLAESDKDGSFGQVSDTDIEQRIRNSRKGFDEAHYAIGNTGARKVKSAFA